MSTIKISIPPGYGPHKKLRDLEKAIAKLDKQEVDLTALFLDAVLGYLSQTPGYQPQSNSLEDLAIRVRRLEELVADELDEEEEEKEEETVKGVTIHIDAGGGYGYCGAAKRVYKPGEEYDSVAARGAFVCMGCRRLHEKQKQLDMVKRKKELGEAGKDG